MSPLNALVYASLGNSLAILVNYFLGYLLYKKFHKKIKSSKIGRKSLLLMHRYGYWALLLTPLPIIGDPLTIAAGLVRLKLGYFALIVIVLRILRYVLIIDMVQ